MKKLPLTLVLVSFNKADVIGLAIESAARGSLAPDLVVVSDDGSSDGTPEAAEAAALKMGLPCFVLRHMRAGRYRLQTMRNSGIANSLDGLILVSDSDCIFGPYAIETHVAIHQAHPLAIGTGPRFEFLEGASGPFRTTFSTLEFAHYPQGIYLVPVGANTSFKKSLWKRLGGFDRSYEGTYGMDEFEFGLRAARAGATCVSDPGAYLFHIPHQTIFGGRSSDSNIGQFNRSFGVDHVHHEWWYIAKRVTPWYWRGNRKRPILGDKVALTAWGAPEGFQPPLHFELSRTLAPFLERVDRFLATRDWSMVDKIWELIAPIDPKLLVQTSAALVFLQDLRWILNHYGDLEELLTRLRHWRAGAEAMDRALQDRSPNIEAS